ncbi:MAG: [Fe-S]-binding protein [Legionellaceae bacterium]|nr:[Fe-S]-binding protein [Legionellaceae bacterium]|tara:strand:- start:1769 stop:2380 length:612 start_codon:yes stop_codon:yes gene_type:complete
MRHALVQAIDAILPQTQCGECGFKGCLPYAEALAQQAVPINLCPPGGKTTLKALANLLDVDAAPYMDSLTTRAPAKALIREAECIGCTKCIQACPVDAILGTHKKMHAIITDECTGCGLCVAPCPVDCIELMPQATHDFDKSRARQRFQAKEVRALRQQHQQQQIYRQNKAISATVQTSPDNDKAAKQAYILAALKRHQQKSS